MANLESKQAYGFFAKLVNSTFQSLADGTFKIKDDIGNYFDDLLAAQPGLEGFKDITSENQTMTVSEADEIKETIFTELANTDPQTRRDVTAIMDGAVSLIRVITRQSYRKGLDEGRAALIAEIQSGDVNLESLM